MTLLHPLYLQEANYHNGDLDGRNQVVRVACRGQDPLVDLSLPGLPQSGSRTDAADR